MTGETYTQGEYQVEVFRDTAGNMELAVVSHTASGRKRTLEGQILAAFTKWFFENISRDSFETACELVL